MAALTDCLLANDDPGIPGIPLVYLERVDRMISFTLSFLRGQS